MGIIKNYISDNKKFAANQRIELIRMSRYVYGSSVVSCTSEDAVNCANNLLLPDVNLKWATLAPGIVKVGIHIDIEGKLY